MFKALGDVCSSYATIKKCMASFERGKSSINDIRSERAIYVSTKNISVKWILKSDSDC